MRRKIEMSLTPMAIFFGVSQGPPPRPSCLAAHAGRKIAAGVFCLRWMLSARAARESQEIRQSARLFHHSILGATKFDNHVDSLRFFKTYGVLSGVCDGVHPVL